MGNKQSRSKSTSDVPDGKKRKKDKKKRSSIEEANKHQSMPELSGGAVPYKNQEEPNVNVTIRRSYKDLNRSKSSVDERVDYKLHRRSTGGWPEKPRTLPRNFGRSKSSAGYPTRNALTPNGTLDPGFPTLDSRDVGRTGRSSARSSKRASRASSMGSSVLPIMPSDFPTIEEIKRKIYKFEELFVKRFTQRFQELPPDTQIGTLVIARDTGVKNRRVSLKEYTIEGGVVPIDLLSPENKERYPLVIPESLFYGIEHVRRDKNNEVDLWCSLARDVVACVAMEAVNELTRIYEYQIALMYDNISIRILVDHAVDCVMEYIQGHYLDRNSVIRSVIQVYPPNHEGTAKYISGVIGNKELKWDLYEIFKKPGLRKELLLYSSEYIGDTPIDCQPWQYHFAEEKEPFLYGYRGQMIEWDFVEKIYKLDMKENDLFKNEIAFQTEDFHRMYMPYKRLFGFEVMQKYCDQTAEDRAKRRCVADMIRTDPLDGPPEREEILPVYRPLVPQSSNLNYNQANLDEIDLTRAQMPNTDLSESSIQNSKLLHANLDNAKLEGANLTGSDISYTNMENNDFGREILKEVTAKHVVLNDPVNVPKESEDMPDGTSSPNRSPGVGDPLNTSFVSDVDGNILPISAVVERHKARVEEEEKLRKEEAEAKANSPTSNSPESAGLKAAFAPTTTSERLNTSSDSARRKKKKKKRRLDQLAGDRSFDSLGQDSVTDYNFLEDKNKKGIVATGGGQSPRINGQHRPNGHVKINGTTSPLSNGTNTVQSNELIQPTVVNQVAYSREPKSASSGNLLDSDVVNRPIQSRYSSVERRPNKVKQRMVKALSHHGQLTTADKANTINGGFTLSQFDKKVFSTAELEQMRRSQIFKMLKGLQIQNLEDNLPSVCEPFVGREDEVLDIADLLNASGRIITLTGAPGNGKSNLAIAVGWEMKKKYVVPIYINANTCLSVDSLLHKLMTTLGLHFKLSEMDYFYQWVNSHEQRLLFILDNVEIEPSLNVALSRFIDNLIHNVKNLRVLSTSHRQFFRGQATHETYRVGDVRQFSEQLLQDKIPDCHPEGITGLSNSVDHSLYGLYLCGNAFKMPDIDSGKLFEDMASGKCEQLPINRIEDIIANYTTSEIEQQTIFKLAVMIRNIIEHMPQECLQLVSVLHNIPADFGVDTAAKFVGSEPNEVNNSLQELVRIGLLLENKGRFCFPKLVQIVAKACWPDDGSRMVEIAQYYVEKLKSLNLQYHSNESLKSATSFLCEYDNVTSMLRWILEREDTYEFCSSFADIDYAIFLSEVLPSDLYEDLYENLGQQAGDKDDVVTRTNALCCSSYKCMEETRFENARAYAENAYENLHAAHVTELDKAFCIQCLGKAYWHDEDLKEKGLTLVKCSLDIYKTKDGLRDIKALYSNEEYGKMLTEKDCHQKARHIFNVSDLILSEILDCHPKLIPGYDCRRSIWDKLYLFSRATEIAEKAVETAKQFYGDHPITATALNNLCECIMKRGSLQDGVSTAVEALAIRIKVLGDHIDTGLSYKMLAHLMMRTGQFDEAVRFAQSGLEVYEKIEAPERYKIDVKTIIAQARYKLESRSSAYVEIDSKNASKTNVASEVDGPLQPVVNAVSTEV